MPNPARLLARVSIGLKMWAAVGLLVAVIVAMAAVARLGTASLGGGLHRVVEEAQPAIRASLALKSELDAARAALGFYLLTHEAAHKAAYLDGLERIEARLAELRGMEHLAADPRAAGLLEQIAADVGRFRGYKARMLALAENPPENFPGRRFAAQNLNPLSQQLLQAVGNMIMSEMEEPASERRKKLLSDLHELRYAWVGVMRGVRAYLAFREEASLKEVALYDGQVQSLLEKLRGYGDDLTLDQDEALGEVAKLRERFMANFEKLKEIHGGPRWRTDAWLVRSEIGPLLARTAGRIDELVGLVADDSARVNRAVLAEADGYGRLMGVLTAVALVVVALVLWIVRSQVLRPILGLRAALRDLAEGEGDLTVRLRSRGDDEMCQASRYFNRLMETLHGMVRDVAEVARQVLERATGASAEVERVSANVSEAADRARSAAAATEEMSASSVEIARLAQEAAEEAERAREQATAGTEAVAVVSREAEGMGERVGTLRGDVERASAKAREMQEMVAVINDIANQTNLLALNAAIEAARAGDMGRGFAVVADEVRELANKTQESTARIASLIDDNMAANDRLESAMESVAEATRTMVERVRETASVIERMASSVGAMNERVAQIAAAAGEQSAATSEMAQTVESISAMEAESAQRVREAVSHLNELAELSERLDQLVRRFRV